MSRAIIGDDDIDVVFNATEQQFRLANCATKLDPNWLSISRILDEEQYRDVRRHLAGPRAEALERELDKLRRIFDYEVPFVRMADHSFDDAVGAFTRIKHWA